ncbi:hypothetical protein P3L51_18365 [Streptomyces sp. PSRA5]|uniref:hypothetical protein n=1 Tax=Streptomyces panacea TaxID=3035064 RepID=UPI00339BF811
MRQALRAVEPSFPAPRRHRSAARGGVTVLALAAAVLTAGAPAAEGSDRRLVLIDNSHADSWLEVDRTANLEIGDGTAGSDHDGSAVDLMDTLINPDSTDDDSTDESEDTG